MAIDQNIVPGKRYVIKFGTQLFEAKAKAVSECGLMARFTFGPWFWEGKWLPVDCVAAKVKP